MSKLGFDKVLCSSGTGVSPRPDDTPRTRQLKDLRQKRLTYYNTLHGSASSSVATDNPRITDHQQTQHASNTKLYSDENTNAVPKTNNSESGMSTRISKNVIQHSRDSPRRNTPAKNIHGSINGVSRKSSEGAENLKGQASSGLFSSDPAASNMKCSNSRTSTIKLISGEDDDGLQKSRNSGKSISKSGTRFLENVLPRSTDSPGTDFSKNVVDMSRSANETVEKNNDRKSKIEQIELDDSFKSLDIADDLKTSSSLKESYNSDLRSQNFHQPEIISNGIKLQDSNGDLEHQNRKSVNCASSFISNADSKLLSRSPKIDQSIPELFTHRLDSDVSAPRNHRTDVSADARRSTRKSRDLLDVKSSVMSSKPQINSLNGAPSSANTREEIWNSNTTGIDEIAESLKFNSANLELVLGKDRMARLLKNLHDLETPTATLR